MKTTTIPSSTRILIWQTLFLKIPTLVICPGVLIGAVSTFSSPMYTNFGPINDSKKRKKKKNNQEKNKNKNKIKKQKQKQLTKQEALSNFNGSALVSLEVCEAVDGEDVWGKLGNKIFELLEEELLVPLSWGLELVLSVACQVGDLNDIPLLFGVTRVFWIGGGSEISFKR